MSKLTLFLTLPLVLLLAVVPLLFKDHAAEISHRDIQCGLQGAYSIYDNPIERMFNRRVVITEQKGDIVTATAYTVFGIPISRVRSTCINGGLRRASRVM